MELLIGSILAGIGLGWIAVPHCYGMCGPLHISVCALNRTKSFTQLSLFNLEEFAVTHLLVFYLVHLGNLLI